MARRQFLKRNETLDLGVGLKALGKALVKSPDRKMLYKTKYFDVMRATAIDTYKTMKDDGDTSTPEQMLAGLDKNIKGMCELLGITDEEILAIFREAVEKAG
jgi:hypothetical protein